MYLLLQQNDPRYDFSEKLQRYRAEKMLTQQKCFGNLLTTRDSVIRFYSEGYF